MIDGGGNHVTARVAMSGEGSGDVDPVHKASAQKGAERIGVIGENDFHHLRFTFTNGVGLKSVFCSVHRYYFFRFSIFTSCVKSSIRCWRPVVADAAEYSSR